MSDLAPRARAAFEALLDLLREVGATHFSMARGVIDETTAAEGYRFLLHLLAAGAEHHLDGDPQRPLFTPHRLADPQGAGRQPRRALLLDAASTAAAPIACAAPSTARSTPRSPSTASIPAAAAWSG